MPDLFREQRMGHVNAYRWGLGLLLVVVFGPLVWQVISDLLVALSG